MAVTPEDRIDNLSVHYYNLGLECARVRNLSGAAENLRRSLEIDKRNTEARNLLGLVYYASGEIVEALSAWVVSKHFCPEDNIADQYLNEVQGDPVTFDTMNQAIIKYNRGLEFARDGKTDLAMIQLKKAVSTYPNFIRAMLLLSLLHMMNNEADKAAKLIYRVLKIDCANSTALYYLKEIDSASAAGKVLNAGARDMVEESFAATKLEDEVTETEVLEDEPNAMAFIGLLAGIIIGIAVVFFLIVPSRDAALKEQYREAERDYSAELNVKLARINALETEAAKLGLENTELTNSLTEAKATIVELTSESPAYAVMFGNLFDASEAYMNHMIDKTVASRTGTSENVSLLYAAADALAAVDITLTADASARLVYDNMCSNVMDRAAQKKYTEGYDYFSVGWYSRAVDCFYTATVYNDMYDAAFYYLGRTYEEMDDRETALSTYKTLVERCPNSKYAAYALERIDVIEDK